MAASPSAPNALALLLRRVATTLPQEVLVLVLRDLPAVELARLASVHKAFCVALRSLREQHPGRRYAAPCSRDFGELEDYNSRLVRAGLFGDVAVIRSMMAAGVDEHGTPLLEARPLGHLIDDPIDERIVDEALWHTAVRGHLQAVELLLAAGANVHARFDFALFAAAINGHADVVQLLLQHGADVHARGNEALWLASKDGHADVVQLLLQHGGVLPSDEDASADEA